jgi:hypothetical protein
MVLAMLYKLLYFDTTGLTSWNITGEKEKNQGK